MSVSERTITRISLLVPFSFCMVPGSIFVNYLGVSAN